MSEPDREADVPPPTDPGAVCDAIQAILDDHRLADDEVLRRIGDLLKDA